MYSVQAVLKTFGIESKLDCEHPGLWVGNNKICAVVLGSSSEYLCMVSLLM